MRDELGGKGANLCEMTNIGLPVPPGFTITTATCNEYTKLGGQLPEGLLDEVKIALADVEAKLGKKLGDPTNPLLLSVRSGCEVLHAGHDGHGPEPWPERCYRRSTHRAN